MNFAKPRFEAEFQESALKGWLHTLTNVAARERYPERRRNKVIRAARWADRILDALPKTPDLCWLVHFRDLGLLRFDCLLAQANRHIHQPSPDPRKPRPCSTAPGRRSIVMSRDTRTGAANSPRQSRRCARQCPSEEATSARLS